LTKLSDDGIRVSVDGKPVIENWTWHGPTHDSGTLDFAADKTVEIVAEHFQIDGYAVLLFSLSPHTKAAKGCASVSLNGGSSPASSSSSWFWRCKAAGRRLRLAVPAPEGTAGPNG
jgi:hypothetical protein